jgi:Tol biopolymer transport system component
MAEVYKAPDTRLDRIVAIKVLPSDKAADPSRFSRTDKRLEFVHQTDDESIWRQDLTAGKASGAATKLIASTWQDNPAYSPDGKKIAFASDRSGSFEMRGRTPMVPYMAIAAVYRAGGLTESRSISFVI